jgi:hypothetical protein
MAGQAASPLPLPRTAGNTFPTHAIDNWDANTVYSAVTDVAAPLPGGAAHEQQQDAPARACSPPAPQASGSRAPSAVCDQSEATPTACAPAGGSAARLEVVDV